MLKKIGLGILWLVVKLISLTFLAFAIIAIPVRVVVSYAIVPYMIMILINFFVTFDGWTWLEVQFYLVAVGMPVFALFSDTIFLQLSMYIRSICYIIAEKINPEKAVQRTEEQSEDDNGNDEELINACYEYLLKKGRIKK